MVKLSIVISYYKTYDLTVKLLDQLVPQLTDETEVYLIDDGCNETRLDIYKDKINIYHSKPNKGGAYACNVGINKSTGKYIAIVDSDDMIANDYVETLLKTIDEHNEDLIFFDWQDSCTGQIVHRPHNYAPWKCIYKNEIMPLFDENWHFSFDVPFQEKIDALNCSKFYLDKVLYFYNSGRLDNLTHLKAEAIRKGEK